MNISVAHFRHLQRLRKTGATLQKNIWPRALFSYVVITKWKGLDRNIIPFHPRTLQLTMETIHYAKVVRVRRLFRCNNLTLWGSGRAILLLENEDYFIRPRLKQQALKLLLLMHKIFAQWMAVPPPIDQIILGYCCNINGCFCWVFSALWHR